MARDRELDELAAFQRASGKFIDRIASTVYRPRGGIIAGDQPKNMDDGAGGCELVCTRRRECAARCGVNGAVVSDDFDGVFDVLGMAGKSGESDVSHHRGDGALSAPDGAVSVHLRVGGNAGLG